MAGLVWSDDPIGQEVQPPDAIVMLIIYFYILLKFNSCKSTQKSSFAILSYKKYCWISPKPIDTTREKEFQCVN